MILNTNFSGAAGTLAVLPPSRKKYLFEITSGNYSVKLARTPAEIESALRLRHDVFNVELGGQESSVNLEFDEYDFKCRHLIVVENTAQKTVGTYRLNTIETAKEARGFYSFNEFSIEDLPLSVLHRAVEIGRACVAREHRNTKVLFLLWKGLTRFLIEAGKRYFFGCCSIFTQDSSVGNSAFQQLKREGHLHEKFSVEPRCKERIPIDDLANSNPIELPNLFNMYLRIGAKICGEPVIDREFGTIDFFVICDALKMNEKYRRMFFD